MRRPAQEAGSIARGGSTFLNGRGMVVALGLILGVSGWWLLWTGKTPWNPLAFWALWTGAALLMWEVTTTGYPSIRRHLALSAMSVPLWWWFEIVNGRVANWEYVYDQEYVPLLYGFLSSIAFSTVVPAIVAATSLWERAIGSAAFDTIAIEMPRPSSQWLLGLGLGLQSLVFVMPIVFYPLTWIAPFLIVDGLLVAAGGRGLTHDFIRGRWREALLIGAAGITCGVLWEFWNFWSYPKWEYTIPLLGFGKVFEMPILGYGGYVPFAWSVVQTVRLADLLLERGWTPTRKRGVQTGTPVRQLDG